MATTKNTYTQSGSTTDYSFTFPYIKQSDVKVSLDNVVKTLTTDYTFANATTVSLNSAPDAGTVINIYRATDDSGLVATFYPGSAIRSADLNDNYTQNLYSTQENTNDAAEALSNSRELSGGVYTSAISIANTAKTTANDADATADEAKATADDAADDVKRWIKDGDGTDTAGDEDDADFTQRPLKPQGIPYAVAQAAAAVSTANDAETKADAADVIADKALDATDTLVATKSGSTWTLQGDGAGSNPKGVKYAVDKADDAVSTANDADTNATTALNNSRESDGSGGYTSAISIANDAKTTANAASTAVGNALLYTLKDNKTQFEAVTFDASDGHEAWEITNSTGITSSYTSFTDNGGSGTAKTVSGIPSGFTGDSGLSARFTYVHSSNTFTWSGYWVNDAETRYVVLGPATGSAPQSTSTTAANLPSGTTAQRPGTPVSGMFRYNTTESEFEGYDGTEWGKVGGGLVTIDGGNFTLGTSLVHTTESYDGGSFN